MRLRDLLPAALVIVLALSNGGEPKVAGEVPVEIDGWIYGQGR